MDGLVDVKIKDYIVYGGEDLNAPPDFSSSEIPSAVKKKFDLWYHFTNSSDSVSWLDVPVDGDRRMFIRKYDVDRDGHRTITYHVGFVLYKEHYKEAGSYRALTKALVALRLDEIQEDLSSGRPIEFAIDVDEKCPSGKSYEELGHMQYFDEKAFDSNLEWVRSAISMKNIDDWFSSLVVAVNPREIDDRMNVIVSRREIGNGSSKISSDVQTKKSLSSTATQPNDSHTPMKTNDIKKYILVHFLGVLIGTVLGVTLSMQANQVSLKHDMTKSLNNIQDKLDECMSELKKCRDLLQGARGKKEGEKVPVVEEHHLKGPDPRKFSSLKRLPNILGVRE